MNRDKISIGNVEDASVGTSIAVGSRKRDAAARPRVSRFYVNADVDALTRGSLMKGSVAAHGLSA